MHTIQQMLNFKTVSISSFSTLICTLFLTTACSNDDDPINNNGAPIIISITPSEGEPGETISVKGSNFAIAAKANQFFFNGVPAEVYVGIPEELLVRVPLEASTGPVCILVPGFDSVMGPVFTVERVASITRTSLYYTGGISVNRATFDELGNVSPETLFIQDGAGLSLGAIEVDVVGQKIYLLDVQNGRPAIYRINLDGTEFETLYDSTDPELTDSGPEPQTLRRITLDLEDQQLYVTDATGRILRGSMDGALPLEVLYDDGAGFNTSPFGISMAIGNDYIYWCEFVTPRILRMRRDGSSTPEELYNASDGLLLPLEIVIDELNNRLIVSDNPFLQNGENVDRILIGNLEGTQLETLFQGDPDIVVNPELGLALDVNNNLLYWGGRPFSGSDDLVLVRSDLSQDDPSPNIIADESDIQGFNHFTIVVTEEGSSNGRLRARVVSQ